MGTVYRSAAQLAVLFGFPLLVGSTLWVASATAAPRPTPSDARIVANQPYEPPDNGGPDGTIGSGTR